MTMRPNHETQKPKAKINAKPKAKPKAKPNAKWLGLALIAATGCGGEDSPALPPPPPPPDPGAYRLAADILATPVQAIDLLFVIDNSESMLEEQESLAARAREALFDVLRAVGDRLPDLHVAVTSTDVGADDRILACRGDGDGGRFLTGAAASEPDGTCGITEGRFLIDVDDGAGGRDTNYEGSLDDAFGCMVQIGTGGCGFEQPLEAMRRALDGSNPENAGFLRPEAMLAVVLVSDEDDCSVFDNDMFDVEQTALDSALGPLSSFRCFEFGVTCDQPYNREPGAKTGCEPKEDSPYMTGVQEYVDFLRGLKDRPGMVVAAGIFGGPEPVVVAHRTERDDVIVPRLDPACISESGEAAPGVRLGGFLDGFPGRHREASICAGDLGSPLTQVAKSIADASTGSTCLQGAFADADPVTPGVQAACRGRVSEADGRWTELAACGKAGDSGCFELVSDPSGCGHTETGLAVDLTRAADLVEGKNVQVECLP